MEYLHDFPLGFQGQVIESDIDGSTCSMVGPAIVFIEGVMGRDYSRGEILTEHGLEYLDYIHEAAFKLGCKLHFDPGFLEGVFHDVVMFRTRLERDIVIDFVLFLFGFVFGLGGFVILGFDWFGPDIFFLGPIRVMHHLVCCDEHDADEDYAEEGFEKVTKATKHSDDSIVVLVYLLYSS